MKYLPAGNSSGGSGQWLVLSIIISWSTITRSA
jgi:hypothetical protein